MGKAYFEISLTDLSFHSHHGVMAQETKVGNEFHVFVTVRIPYTDDIAADNLDATVNYAILHSIVAEEMSRPRKLLEAVAASIAGRIKGVWPGCLGGNVKICKSTPPIAGITGKAEVTIVF